MIKKFIEMLMLIGSFEVTKPIEQFNPLQLNPVHRVTKVATPVSEKNLGNVLCRSHIKKYNKVPNKKKLALAWAHISLENGRGKKVWNNNLGNQGPFSGRQKYYYHLRRGWPYRSFETPDDSAEAYWTILEKCSRADQAFGGGYPVAAAQALKNCNYYSSSVEGYSKNLNSLYYEALSRIVEPCEPQQD